MSLGKRGNSCLSIGWWFHLHTAQTPRAVTKIPMERFGMEHQKPRGVRKILGVHPLLKQKGARSKRNHRKLKEGTKMKVEWV